MNRNLLVIFAIILVSCNEKKIVRNEIQAMLNQSVCFLDSLELIRITDDNINVHIVDINHRLHLNQYKIIIYFTPLACNSCNLDILSEWMDYIHEQKNGTVEFIFIFGYENNIKNNQLIAYIKELGFHHHFYIDKKNTFFKHNPFISKYPALQTFLLNYKNEIKVVGSSLKRPIKGLYHKIVHQE